MLISVQHLVDRARHPRQRADELRRLRKRLGELPRPEDSGRALVALAEELLRLREELHRALSGVTSCSECAVGYRRPAGRWDGGRCCASRAPVLFSDDELASLKLTGTTPTRLVAPRSDLAGCVFRGPTGCSLEVRDRPNICVRYVCHTLQRELAERGDQPEVAALAQRLNEKFRELVSLRVASEVLPREMLDAMD